MRPRDPAIPVYPPTQHSLGSVFNKILSVYLADAGEHLSLVLSAFKPGLSR